jgi:transcriptional regulator with XRE-family HTH domain
MNIGHHVMAWRRHQGLTQIELAGRTNLSRPYLSRLEKGRVDPALSVLRRLAVALNIGLGQLIEELPPEKTLNRHQIDRLARAALRPGTEEARSLPEARVLAGMFRERRKALGLHVRKRKRASSIPSEASGDALGVNASRWLRAALGEKQWDALLRRIDKLAANAPEKL